MHKALGTKRALPIAIAMMVILGVVLPIKYIGWLGWFGGLTGALIGPVSHPFTILAHWLTPASPREADDPTVKSLREQIDVLTTQLLRAQQENARLYTEIEEQYQLSRLNPDAPVRHVNAPVTGASSDLYSGILTVRAGHKQGVTLNTVAVVSGLQLLGKVVEAGARTANVQPITGKAAGKIRARVMFESIEDRLICVLDPVGDGTLRGPVDSGEVSQGRTLDPAVGQLVRLDDLERWPEHAQMLVVGKIEKVEPSPEHPLRKIITVRPTLVLDRVSEVVLRVSAEPPDSPPVKGGT